MKISLKIQKDDRVRLFYHDPLEMIASKKGKGKKIIKGLLDAETVEFTASEDNNDQSETSSQVWMYNPHNAKGDIDRTCPSCGQAQGLVIFGIRSARMTDAISRTLYSSVQNEEYIEEISLQSSNPEETPRLQKPRLLIFSDSVQDAAHRASIAEIRNTLAISQKSLFKVLNEEKHDDMTLHDVIENVPDDQLKTYGPDGFTSLFIPKAQTWRKTYRDLVEHDKKIEDDRFINQMKIRLGWDYFSDSSYRSHFSHTLEANGMAAANVRFDLLYESAVKLADQLRNELPDAPEFAPELLAVFLFGLVQKMRCQGSVAHRYIDGAIATSQGKSGLNWYGAARQMGLGKTGILPSPDFRTGLAPIPVTLGPRSDGFEKINKAQKSGWYQDWLFRMLGTTSFRFGSSPHIIYRIVMKRLEADGIVRRVNIPEGHYKQDKHAWLIEPEKITVSSNVTGLVCNRCGRRETVLAGNADSLTDTSCVKIGCKGHLQPAIIQARPALRRFLEAGHIHRVVAREHTGMLDSDDRRHIETGFINEETPWSPNLISATPTLEMELISGFVYRSAWLGSPEEANYVQRMGRSGAVMGMH